MLVYATLRTYLCYGYNMTSPIFCFLLSSFVFYLGGYPPCHKPHLSGKNLAYKHHSHWHLHSAFPATLMLLHAVMLSASTDAYTQLGLFSFPNQVYL